MEQSPSWEANQSSASQEILRVVRNPKIHYDTHNSLLSTYIINQIQSELLTGLLNKP